MEKMIWASPRSKFFGCIVKYMKSNFWRDSKYSGDLFSSWGELVKVFLDDEKEARSVKFSGLNV